MDKELASFHTYLFSLCVNASAAQATSTGNRQLKLTRRSWLPAEPYCQVEQASTALAQTSWQTGLILYVWQWSSLYVLILCFTTAFEARNIFCSWQNKLCLKQIYFHIGKGLIHRKGSLRSEIQLSNLTLEWGRQKTRSCFISRKYHLTSEIHIRPPASSSNSFYLFDNIPEHWPWKLGRHYEAAAAAGSKERGREKPLFIQARRAQWHLGMRLVIISIIKRSADYSFLIDQLILHCLFCAINITKPQNMQFTLK